MVAESCLILKTRNYFCSMFSKSQLKVPRMLGLLGWLWSWELAPLPLGCYREVIQESKTFLSEVTGDLLSRRLKEGTQHYHSPSPWYFRLQGWGRAPRSTLSDEEMEGKCCVRVTPVFSAPGQWRKRRQKRMKWSEVGGRRRGVRRESQDTFHRRKRRAGSWSAESGMATFLRPPGVGRLWVDSA